MTTIFVPIDEVSTTGRSVIATGEVMANNIEATPTAAAVTEMAGPQTSGKILSCIVTGNILKLSAEIWDQAAMAKVWEKIYRGFLLNMLPDGRLLQCGLVDRPDALVAKRGSGVLPMPLDIADAKAIISTTPIGVQKMATTNKNLDDQHLVIGDGAHADNAAAIELLKTLRAAPPAATKPGHAGLMTWLQNRAGR